jgi:vacuolar-type H+-ATPase subunit F/Vma7
MANETKLINIYRRAAQQLRTTVRRADPRKPIILIRKVIMGDINKITSDLERETKNWLVVEIPQEYKRGSQQAVADASKLGLTLDKTGFGQVHKEAIQALTEDAYLDFAAGIEGVRRAGRGFVSEIVKKKINERIVSGQLEGKALDTVKKEIKQLVEDTGFTALVDRGGKHWSIDSYAEMLVRTHVIKANGEGTKNRLLTNQVDLVEISKHNSSCPICQPYEGEVYSLTGGSKGYKKAPELPIHPNCRHTYLPYIED